MSSAESKAYLAKHGLETIISDAVLQVIRDRPSDPLRSIGKALMAQSSTAGQQEAGAGAARALKVATWNIAAINNNPFEYWITHPDPNYDQLMVAVERFVEEPGELDVKVGDVFTKEMFGELDALMTAQGWDCAAECSAYYDTLAEKTIIGGFLKDKDLGNKRLMSMPDRMTNTIDLVGGARAFRPTVISSSEVEMTSVATWWKSWKPFIFDDKLELPGKKGAPPSSKPPCALLSKIPRDKYPALTEAEEAMSVRLQVLCLGIFDALLVHMLNSISSDGTWENLKKQILNALLHKKEDNVIRILETVYAEADLLFLQEVRTTNALEARLSSRYTILMPQKASKADQNSAILLAKDRFDVDSSKDVTAEALEKVPPGGASIADGDLLVVAVSDAAGVQMLLASFHGDTDGLATAPTLAAVHALHRESYAGHQLVFGLDANVYNKPKPGKQAGAADFLADVAAKGYAASSGERLESTTFNMRTFLQPQLQKACRATEKKSKGDLNPKDYILFQPEAFVAEDYGVDNTAKKECVEQVIPTLEWPSDHCLVYSTLAPVVNVK